MSDKHRHPLTRVILILILIALLATPCTLAFAKTSRQKSGNGEIVRLFREEIQQAEKKIHWRGAKLSDDTLYAIALTGASWEPFWGKETLFSLSWGSYGRLQGQRRTEGQNYIDLVHQIKSSYDQRDYRKAVETAFSNFSLDEIGVDIYLKEPVGGSLMALGKPEQAFPIFAAPFEMPPAESRLSFYNRQFRTLALDASERAGLMRESIVFALSLILSPGKDASAPDARALKFLENSGVDLDRVLLGIIQAPERLPRLPAYAYAACDLMALRASPRLLPYLLTLSESPDAYLSSRAILGLGIAAYQPRSNEPPGWAERILNLSPRAYGVSSGQLKLIEKRLKDGITSEKRQVRAAAALSLSLIDSEDAPTILRKLSKDRAYLLSQSDRTPFNPAPEAYRIPRALRRRSLPLPL